MPGCLNKRSRTDPFPLQSKCRPENLPVSPRRLEAHRARAKPSRIFSAVTVWWNSLMLSRNLSILWRGIADVSSLAFGTFFFPLRASCSLTLGRDQKPQQRAFSPSLPGRKADARLRRAIQKGASWQKGAFSCSPRGQRKASEARFTRSDLS